MMNISPLMLAMMALENPEMLARQMATLGRMPPPRSPQQTVAPMTGVPGSDPSQAPLAMGAQPGQGQSPLGAVTQQLMQAADPLAANNIQPTQGTGMPGADPSQATLPYGAPGQGPSPLQSVLQNPGIQPRPIDPNAYPSAEPVYADTALPGGPPLPMAKGQATAIPVPTDPLAAAIAGQRGPSGGQPVGVPAAPVQPQVAQPGVPMAPVATTGLSPMPAPTNIAPLPQPVAAQPPVAQTAAAPAPGAGSGQETGNPLADAIAALGASSTGAGAGSSPRVGAAPAPYIQGALNPQVAEILARLLQTQGGPGGLSAYIRG